jgi:putative hydrolase of the HAD superfamily
MALVDSYEGFIFDYGGVLVEHQTDGDHETMAAMAGISKQSFSDGYWGERLEYDRGHLSGIDYWRKVGSRGGKTLSENIVAELIDYDNSSWMKFDQLMWDWVTELRSNGKRVAVLSNMPSDLGRALKERTDKFQQFHHLTLSYEVHAAKPEAAIYEHCLEGLDLSAEKTLFFDDRIENVHGAELLGIRAIQFTSREDVLLRIRE